MKKTALFILVILTAQLTHACDICGCGVGSYYIGILPEFNKKMLGLRYRLNSLRTHIGPGGTTSYLTTDETFSHGRTLGRMELIKKIRLIGYVPYSFNEKLNQGDKHSRSGLGDIGLQAYYQLLNKTGSSASKLMIHSYRLGAGIKLPTGNYDPAEKDDSQQSANTFQLGTGTVDFTFNLMYDLRIQDFWY